MLSSPTYVNLNRENDGTPNPATPGYVCMKQRKKTDAQEETELRPMLSMFFFFILPSFSFIFILTYEFL